MINVLIIIILAVLITGSFRLARRLALTCPKCKSRNCEKTGKRKDVERRRRALIASAVPVYDYEYKCKECGHTFWSTIESIYSP